MAIGDAERVIGDKVEELLALRADLVRNIDDLADDAMSAVDWVQVGVLENQLGDLDRILARWQRAHERAKAAA